MVSSGRLFGLCAVNYFPFLCDARLSNGPMVCGGPLRFFSVSAVPKIIFLEFQPSAILLLPLLWSCGLYLPASFSGTGYSHQCSADRFTPDFPLRHGNFSHCPARFFNFSHCGRIAVRWIKDNFLILSQFLSTPILHFTPPLFIHLSSLLDVFFPFSLWTQFSCKTGYRKLSKITLQNLTESCWLLRPLSSDVSRPQTVETAQHYFALKYSMRAQ
ncbi:hypothetical protein K438DRAFT_1139513 [Mycena galopus ATCC 62051]|nr:hypothetical protein K438DRAFT_1139513 [Mycena galopus ATCC 62051]